MAETMHFAWPGGLVPSGAAADVFRWRGDHPAAQVVVWVGVAAMLAGTRATFAGHVGVEVLECGESLRPVEHVRPAMQPTTLVSPMAASAPPPGTAPSGLHSQPILVSTPDYAWKPGDPPPPAIVAGLNRGGVMVGI